MIPEAKAEQASLIEEGRKTYGSTFDRIFAGYQALGIVDPENNGLKMLARSLDSKSINGILAKAGVDVVRISPEVIDRSVVERIGDSLARKLEASAKRNYITSDDGIAYLITEILEDCKVVLPPAAFSNPKWLNHPTNYGRRAVTGQTEHPGSGHGFDPATLPPF
jgi:hypothetical protein